MRRDITKPRLARKGDRVLISAKARKFAVDADGNRATAHPARLSVWARYGAGDFGPYVAPSAIEASNADSGGVSMLSPTYRRVQPGQSTTIEFIADQTMQVVLRQELDPQERACKGKIKTHGPIAQTIRRFREKLGRLFHWRADENRIRVD